MTFCKWMEVIWLSPILLNFVQTVLVTSNQWGKHNLWKIMFVLHRITDIGHTDNRRSEVSECNSRPSVGTFGKFLRERRFMECPGADWVCWVSSSFLLPIIVCYLLPLKKARWDRSTRFWVLLISVGVSWAHGPVWLSWELHLLWRELESSELNYFCSTE